jgi:hypothetical protein
MASIYSDGAARGLPLEINIERANENPRHDGQRQEGFAPSIQDVEFMSNRRLGDHKLLLGVGEMEVVIFLPA